MRFYGSVFTSLTLLLLISASLSPGQTVSSTITTAPAGLTVTIDGTPFIAPATVNWAPGTAHTIGVATTVIVSTGTRHIFSNWSDTGGATHLVVAPPNSMTFLATFVTQYQLTTSVPPAGGGFIIGGGSIVATPASGDGFYNSGTMVELTATPATDFHFSFFSGDLSGSNNPQSVAMTAPRSVSANFSPGTGGNIPPYAVELSPFEGAGVTQTFSGTFNDANGWTDIAKATFFFHESYAGTFGPARSKCGRRRARSPSSVTMG